MIHPLCGFSLKIGTGLIAALDMVKCLIRLGIAFCAVELKEDHSNNLTNKTGEEPEFLVFGHLVSSDVYENLVFAIPIIVMADYILRCWMSLVLIRASYNRDASDCRLWLWLRAILFVLNFTFTVLVYATVGSSWYWTAWFLLPFAVYSLWKFIVVNEFRKEVKATCGNVKLREEICDEV